MTRWKYVSGDWYSDREGRTDIDVYCAKDGPIKTGLLDQSGAPLYRVPGPRPLGFNLSGNPMAKHKGGKRKC